MAVFSKLVTTVKGQELIAKMLAGEQNIVFTRVSVSDNEYTLDQLENLEALAGVRQTGSVSKVYRTNDSTVKVETVLTNTELAEGYYMKAIALYAKDGTEEILYAAAVETSGNCFMPAFGGVTVSGAYLQLVTTVSNAENVTVEVNDSVHATIGDIKDLQEQINRLDERVDVLEQGTGADELALLNAAKLEKLNMLGEIVYSDKWSFEFNQIQNGTFTSVSKLGNEVYDRLDGNEVYNYILESRIGLAKSIKIDSGFKRNIVGYIDIMLVGRYGQMILKQTDTPMYMYLPDGRFSIEPLMVGIGAQKIDFNNLEIRFRPFLFELTDQDKVVDYTGTISGSMNLNLTISKAGYNLAAITGGGGSGGGGTSNYNLLTNKPSINSVTLQGNLTAEQLGLNGSSGGADVVQMTYEETLAELNAEEVTA